MSFWSVNPDTNQPAFRPHPSGTVTLAAGASTGNIQISPAADEAHVRVFNDGSVTVYINWGTSNAVTAATATDMPIPAGAVEIFDLNGATWIAAITASSTSNVRLTPGKGL